jgi:hypothetical protein
MLAGAQRTGLDAAEFRQIRLDRRNPPSARNPGRDKIGSEEAPDPHEAVTRERLFQGHAGRIVPESFGEVNPEGSAAAHHIASGSRRDAPDEIGILVHADIENGCGSAFPSCGYLGSMRIWAPWLAPS